MLTRYALVAFCIFSLAGAAAQDCEPIAALEPLDTWQTISGAYAAGGSVVYEVPMDLSVRYEFKVGCGNGAAAERPTLLELITPLCGLIMPARIPCAEGSPMLGFNSFFSDGGVIYLKLRGEGSEAAAFTLAYRSVGGNPGPCNVCPSFDEELRASSLWDVVHGSYGPGACRTYRLPVSEGVTYTFKTGCADGAATNGPTRLSVRSSMCAEEVVERVSCGDGAESIAWTATAMGFAYVQVDGEAGEQADFSLAYRSSGDNGTGCNEPLVRDAHLSLVPRWLRVSDSYLGVGCRVYQFDALADHDHVFKTGCGDGAAADHATRLELIDAAGSVLVTVEAGCEPYGAELRYRANADGRYRLRVSSAEGVDGRYTLAFQRTPPCTRCPEFDAAIEPIPTLLHAEGTIVNGGCYTYKVDVQQDRTYVFTLGKDRPSTDVPVTMSLLDADCRPIGGGVLDREGGGQRMYHYADRSGPLYLQVQALQVASGLFGLSYREHGAGADLCAAADTVFLAEDFGVEVQVGGALGNVSAEGDVLAGDPGAVYWYTVDLRGYCALSVSACAGAPVDVLPYLFGSCSDTTVLYRGVVQDVCGSEQRFVAFNAIPDGTYHVACVVPAELGPEEVAVMSFGCNHITVGAGPVIPDQQRWAVYPNPGSDRIMVRRKSDAPDLVQVSVYDALGKDHIAGSRLASGHELDVSALPAGVYFIHFVEGSQRSVQRWIKQ